MSAQTNPLPNPLPGDAGSSLLPRPTVTMTHMLRRSCFRFSVLLTVLVLVTSTLASFAQQTGAQRGRKFKMPPPTGRVEVTVLRDDDGKPIENAAVIFHEIVKNKDAGNMELKTNEDGKTVIDVLPLNSLARLQIIAHGYQTYGQDYKLDKASMAIEIRMKRPGAQYSIYEMRDTTAGASPVQPASNTTPAPAGSPASGTPAK